MGFKASGGAWCAGLEGTDALFGRLPGAGRLLEEKVSAQGRFKIRKRIPAERPEAGAAAGKQLLSPEAQARIGRCHACAAGNV